MLDIAEVWALTVLCWLGIEIIVGRWARWITYALLSRPKSIRAFRKFFSFSEEARYGHLLYLRHSLLFPTSGVVIVAKYLALPTYSDLNRICFSSIKKT